jgi:uncharacterized repeat protein (TIGR01451 family)
MFSTRLAALVAVFAIAAVALPAVASANTGTVTCDSRGVVFSYRANFNPSRVSTETVNGVSRDFTVPKWTAVEDIWPGVTGNPVVGATWSGGGIATVTLHCPPAPPAPPPVVVTPPPVAPPPAVPVTPPPVAPPVTPEVPVVSSAPAPAATPTPTPVLSLRKKAGASTVAAGASVKYTLVVTSKGGTAHGVVVCDKLPAHMTYVSLGNATMEDGKACWTVGDLTGSLSLSLTAKVDADAPAGSLVNNATATSDNAGKAKAKAAIKVPARHGVKGRLKRTAGVTG